MALGQPPAETPIEQIFLSAGPEPGQMTVTWQCAYAYDGWDFTYAASAGSAGYTSKVNGPVDYSYDRSDGYSYKSKFIYNAVMTAPGVLAGSATPYTIAGTGKCPTCKRDGSFVAPPNAGDSTATLAIIGDLGQSVNSSATIDHVASNLHKSGGGYDAVIICCDLSYADAEHSPAECHHPGGCSQERWDSWGQLYETLGSKTATMPLPGNHEIETEHAPLKGSAAAPGAPPVSASASASASTANNATNVNGATTTPFLSYVTRFAAVKAPTGPLYYSWEVGPLHAIHMNSYHDYIEPDVAFTTASAQYKWLVSDLATINRTKTPWVAVFLHAPWYNSNSHHHDEKEELGMQALYEPIFHNANVDLLLAG